MSADAIKGEIWRIRVKSGVRHLGDGFLKEETDWGSWETAQFGGGES
jgi:hypothetical protein